MDPVFVLLGGAVVMALLIGVLIGMCAGEANEAKAWRAAGESGEKRYSGKRYWHVFPERRPPSWTDEDFYHDAFSGK